MLHFVFKVSSTCSHTRLKSLSPLSNCFIRTEPQRIGLAKLSNSWKSRRQTLFHQICDHPTAPISTQWTARSGTYCRNGFTSQAVSISTSYDAGLLRNGTSLTSAFDIKKAVGEWRKRLQACVAAGALWTQGVTFIIYDILYLNFKTWLFEILLFCSVNTGCFVE